MVMMELPIERQFIVVSKVVIFYNDNLLSLCVFAMSTREVVPLN
jgi:hypothetical protein